MKKFKFIKNLILAFLPLILVIGYTFLNPYGYMDKEYPSFVYTKEVSSGINNPIKGMDNTILIIGDSRAMADLVPEYLSENSVNLALGGATSIEMYYTLKKYLENNETPDKVIVMFAPFHYSVIDNYWTRTAYFNYLTLEETMDLYSYAEATGSETLLKKGYQNDLISYRLRTPDKFLPALINSKLFTRYESNKQIYKNLVESKGYGDFGNLNGCSELSYETHYDKMHNTKDALLLDLYLNRLLTFLKDKNIPTTLLIPPLNESSYNGLYYGYANSFTDYMENLKNKYPEFNIHTELNYMDDSYFGDSSHLNYEGAVKYTKELKDY